MSLKAAFSFLAATALLTGNVPALEVTGLRCEYLGAPCGMDVAQPRLSWQIRSGRRGERQTAYQVLAASSEEGLRDNRGDLWDTGRVASDQSIQVTYGGRALTSRMRCHWKVRVWGRNGTASSWSAPASWTMGLLAPDDWQAKWIADAATVAEAQNRPPAGPHNGYHSELAGSADVRKWVAIDLGASQSIDAFRLFPARPYDWQPDTPGFLFPLRFKIEVGQQADFADARVVIDHTQEDEPNPGTNAPLFQTTPIVARYVRLQATRLRLRSGTDYGLALAEMEALSQGTNLARGAHVTALDSIEAGGWARRNLVDGRTQPQASARAPAPKPAVLFRKTFELDSNVKRATAYVTGLGLYELRINGRRVGENLLAPEWTSYLNRVQYQTCDVTGLLRRGANTLGATVGEGWFMGRLMGISGDAYGTFPRFLLQLELELADGGRQLIVTGPGWQSSTEGPIRAAGIYDGETYDGRLENARSDRAGFEPPKWKPVRVMEPEPARLAWQRNEPIRVNGELKAVSLTEPKPGVYVFDFGQNMVGWCRLKATGAAGTMVTLRHAEMTNEDGTIYTANLRGAPQVDRFILQGAGEETFEPHFTYHGFRHVELTGLRQRPRLDSLVGKVIHSAAPEAGRFECSQPAINQLMRNILWTQRANLMSSPTDCPQRDERFGWMGDIQAFSQTAIFNMNLAAFLSKWLQDVRDDQAADGRFPDYAPHPGDPNAGASGAPAWADAGVIVPWRVYQNYADTRLLADHFDSARRWVDYIWRLNPDLIWSKGRGNDYNDWLNGDWIGQKDWPSKGGSVPNEVFATSFFAHSAELVGRMAEVLGREDQALRYRGLARKIRTAFNKQFVKPDGRIEGDTQAGYALALDFDLLPLELRAKAAQRLVESIRKHQDHLSTGIQTTHRAMLELTRYGYNDTAWQLLTNRTFPSWGYMLDNGATTIWERWDGYVKGRGFQDPGMNSFNHWAFGAVGEWIWRNIAGINPDDAGPGYKHFVIRPQVCAGLTWAKATYDSIHGAISSEWRLEPGTFKLNIRVPPNTTATVFVPTAKLDAVKEGRRRAANAPGIELRSSTEPGVAQYEVQSGLYSFSAPRPASSDTFASHRDRLR
ncbi:MAG: family 78 glycoside hydrolase catalytic domain [Verrucomicrobiota bacterium]